MPQLTGCVKRVGVDDDHACPQRAENGDRVLHDVGHHQGYAVAFLQAKVLQVCGEITAEAIQFRETDLLAEVHVGRTVCEVFKALVKDIQYRRE